MLDPYTPSINPFLTNGTNNRKNAVAAPRASTRGASNSVPKALAREESSAFARSPSRAADASNRRPFSAARRPLASIAIRGYTVRPLLVEAYRAHHLSFPHLHAVLQEQPTQTPAYARTPP